MNRFAFVLLALAIIATLDSSIHASTAHGQPATSTLTIVTIPRMSGVPYLLINTTDGSESQALTDVSGNATFSVPAGTYLLASLQTARLNESCRISFYRWGDIAAPGAFQPSRTVNLSGYQVITSLIRVESKVNIGFNDQEGHSVDSSSIESVAVRANDGQTYTFHTYNGLWFPGNRFQQIVSGWKLINITYTIDSVSVLGRNVVQHGLNVFAPSASAIWIVPLQLYTLEVTVSDLIFGFHLNTKITVKDLSSGNPIRAAKSTSGAAVFDDFPKGDYTVQSSGWGAALSVPEIFTKTSTVQVKVFSYIDVAFLAGLGAVFWMLVKSPRFRTLRAVMRSHLLAGDLQKRIRGRLSKSHGVHVVESRHDYWRPKATGVRSVPSHVAVGKGEASCWYGGNVLSKITGASISRIVLLAAVGPRCLPDQVSVKPRVPREKYCRIVDKDT